MAYHDDIEIEDDIELDQFSDGSKVDHRRVEENG